MNAPADDLRERFWSEFERIRTGMLGYSDGEEPRFQPMTAHFEERDGVFWFYARASSPVADAAEAGGFAMFNYTGGGHDLYACVEGRLTAEPDAERRRQFWSGEAARWFPDGPDSPDVAFLRFEAESAKIWLPRESEAASSLRLGGRGAPEDIRANVQL